MFDRVTFDTNIMGGSACIRGMMIPVSVLLKQIVQGASFEEILYGYPDLDQNEFQTRPEWIIKIEGDGKIMRIKLIVFCVLLLVSVSAFGKEKMDLAKEVMVLTKYDQTIAQVKAHIEKMQTEMGAELKSAEGKSEKTTESLNALQAKIFNEMENQLVEILATVYTVEELAGMIEFWKSPVGRSVIEKQPLVLEKTMELSQRIMKRYIQEIQRLMDNS